MASDEPGPGQQYALQARKHIATLRHSRPGTVIEVRWCPAHKELAGNEKADEWAKIAAEKAGTRGVEWPNFPARTEVRGGAAPATIPRQPQAGDLGEEVGGGTSVGWGPDLQEEVPTAGQPKARWHGSWEHQEARLAVLPDQDGALPDRAVPQLDKEPSHPAMPGGAGTERGPGTTSSRNAPSGSCSRRSCGRR